jgi:hypothetical protein
MDFPILTLLDTEASVAWIEQWTGSYDVSGSWEEILPRS